MQLIVHGQLLWTEREKWGEDGGVGNPEWHFNDEGKREGWRTHGGSTIFRDSADKWQFILSVIHEIKCKGPI